MGSALIKICSAAKTEGGPEICESNSRLLKDFPHLRMVDFRKFWQNGLWEKITSVVPEVGGEENTKHKSQLAAEDIWSHFPDKTEIALIWITFKERLTWNWLKCLLIVAANNQLNNNNWRKINLFHALE